MDVEREWRKAPPTELQTSLGAMVRDFQWRFPRERRDMVVEYCREAPTLELAIRRAVASKDGWGKHHNHQSKINALAYEPMTNTLLANERLLLLCRTFDELHDVVESMHVSGWGPVGVYDIATRIGAFLQLEPESVYLHAGVKLGWVALLHAQDLPCDKTQLRVHRENWPDELKVLTADEVEDFLCTYRTVFWRLKYGS